MKHPKADVPMISDATVRNWRKLNPNVDGKLTSRANKRLSKKSVLPVEYFSNKENIAVIQRFVDFYKEKKYEIGDVMFSIGMNLLTKSEHSHQTVETHRGATRKIVASMQQDYQIIPEILDFQFPDDETDLLGLVYQMLLTEGEKNTIGSYYTPFNIAKNMTKGLDFSGCQTFFDPCCGSGVFMLALENARPEQIFGCDNDPIAVMLAKFNLLLKFPDEDFEPQICCCDYLKTSSPQTPGYLKHLQTYIVSNPPWGAAIIDSEKKRISQKESFSFFFEKSFQQLENDGVVRFLLPESILNVRCHKAFREFLLNNGNLASISLYSDAFSGVQTKYVDVELRRQDGDESRVKVIENDRTRFVSKSSFLLTKNLNFNLLSEEDEKMVRKILSKGKYTLAGSTWALGVITGDNRHKLKDRQGRRLEPIYTGKEIEPYTLKTPRKFIEFKRGDFQQVAKDEIYRAEEKLVYKFISNKLVFAYDNTKSLFLNSANILIPNIPGMSIKTVLAFLNSDLYEFIYKSLFDEIKILRGNLEELPFPKITEKEDELLKDLVNKVLAGDRKQIEKINKTVENIFLS
ncbi:MAG: N-6 DNA methylase [Bacteroidales bacterium]|nr:N-6 DNA methylase [Bacteroidales bacterium]